MERAPGLLLALDTSSEMSGFAIVAGGRLLAEAIWRGQRQGTAEQLLEPDTRLRETLLRLRAAAQQSGIPWRTQMKLVATYEVAWGVRVSGVLQSLPGYVLGTPALQAGGIGGPNLTSVSGLGSAFTVSPATRYTVCPGHSASLGCVVGALVVPGMNTASFSVPLVAPQTENTPRIDQVDVAVSKRISIGRVRFEPKVDVFNLLNSSDYFSVASTTFSPTAVAGVSALRPGGVPTAYLAPQLILQGRLVRIGANVSW